MPKTVITLVLFLLALCTASAQLTLDLGPDTAYCIASDQNASYRLGDKMQLSGGVEPYRFAWHTTYDIGLSDIYTASAFLNDTTAQFPEFLDYPLANEWNPFYLTAYDANGDSVTDTINVWFTNYAFVLGYEVFYIEPGDSILLPYSMHGNGAGGIEPVTAYWVPDESIYDASEGYAWFKPDTTTIYNIYRVDNTGCKSAENTVYQIYVSPKAQLNEIHHNTELRIVQKGNNIAFSNPLGEKAEVNIYTLNGKLIETSKTRKSEINLSSFSSEKTLIVKVVLGDKSGSCLFVNQ
ncbi:hypothetical protein ACE1ET_12465 [Saccharicrinis sp. FJH62]|uniref:hypothetical protein n=1 Tax=Saccharicrinis sp. FJH62 TaxID=3344657 RepID=UPI0035D45AAD